MTELGTRSRREVPQQEIAHQPLIFIGDLLPVIQQNTQAIIVRLNQEGTCEPGELIHAMVTFVIMACGHASLTLLHIPILVNLHKQPNESRRNAIARALHLWQSHPKTSVYNQLGRNRQEIAERVSKAVPIRHVTKEDLGTFIFERIKPRICITEENRLFPV